MSALVTREDLYQVVKNLQEYIDLDIAYQSNNSVCDFDDFCISHCRDIDIVLSYTKNVYALLNGEKLENQDCKQDYQCEEYIIALLKEIEEQLCMTMYNITSETYLSPFRNNCTNFKNDVFEVKSYDWDREIKQEYNFKWKDIEISWYKYLGRDTTINKQITMEYAIEMFNDCLKSIKKMEDEEMGW